MTVLHRIVVCSCLFLSVWAASARAETLQWDLAYPEPVLGQAPGGEVLLLERVRLAGAPGEPLLPLDRVTFLLPAGHRPVAIELKDAETEWLPGRFDIAPAQAARPPSRPAAGLTPADPEVYTSDELLFSSFVESGQVQGKRGYGVFTVLIHPLAYRPQSGRVKRLISGRLVVTTRRVGPVSTLYRARPEDAALIARRLNEISALSSYPAAPPVNGTGRLDPAEYDYLIVTPEAFTNIGTENSLEALVAYRQSLGMSASLVTLEWIRTGYDGVRPDGGVDDATRIRDFLTDAYSTWGTRYVLLVGDADGADNGGESGDDLLPVRKFYIDALYTGEDPISDFIPADLYYACLDGSFDDDADGLYGEPNDGPGGGPVDLMAELYVGRAPADSVTEVSQFVAKTLAYERSMGSWLSDVRMIGENLNEAPMTWAGDYLDDLISGSTVAGFSSAGFDAEPFFACQTLYDRDSGGAYSWDVSDVVAVLNSGPHIINHLGHSNEFYNMRMNISDADGLINPRPFFQYSQGCYNGSFDNQVDESGYINAQDCFAEHLVMGVHGAFAAVVNSRYGLYSPGSTDSPSQAFQRTFWDAYLAEGMAEIGRALADSKEELAYMFNYTSYRWVGYELNLLGDPAVRLKRSINTSDPLLGVYPPALEFFVRQGEAASLSETLTVANDGVGSLGWSAASDQTWLSVSPASGQAGDEVLLEVDTTGLAPGEHQALVTFESAEAANSPMDYTVKVTVVDPPTLAVPSAAVAPVIDGLMEAGEWDLGRPVPIDEGGLGTVMLYAQVTDNTLYLAVEDRLDVQDNAWPEWQLIFDQDLDQAWPAQPAGEGVFWYIYGGRYFVPLFNAGQGLDQGDFVENPAGFSLYTRFVDGHRVYEAAIDLLGSELDVGPDGQFGMAFRNGYESLERVRTGRWPWVVPTLDDQRFFGLVDLNPQGASLTAVPRELGFAAVLDDAPPPAQTVGLADATGGSLDFTLTTSQPWLVATPEAGQTPESLSISVDPGGLEVGAYYGYVELASPEAWNAPYRIPVHLDVQPAPAVLAVDPLSFSLTVVEGGTPPGLTLAIENQGGRPMTFSVGSDSGWLAFAPALGTLSPGGAMDVAGSVDLGGLGVGSHQALIRVDGGEAQNSPLSIPLTLEVVADRPVPPVSDLAALAGEGRIQLTWQLADDPLVAGAIVRRGTGTPPAAPDLGTALADGPIEEILDEGLVDGTTYCYAVWAVDQSGRTSEVRSVCAVPGPNRAPPTPSLRSPADGALLADLPELAVEPVLDPDGDAVSYTFALLSDGGEVLQTGTGTPADGRVVWSPAGAPEPGAAYLWRAMAEDDRGAASAWSAERSFRIRAVSTDGGLDGGGDTDTGAGGGGCSCATDGGGGGAGWLLLALALGLLVHRRTTGGGCGKRCG